MVLIPLHDVSKFLLTDAIADVVVLATAHPRSGAHCKIHKECPGHDAAPGVGTFFPSFAVEPGAQVADVDAANDACHATQAGHLRPHASAAEDAERFDEHYHQELALMAIRCAGHKQLWKAANDMRKVPPCLHNCRLPCH